VENDGLQHPLKAHMVGYFGKEQTLKDQIKIYAMSLESGWRKM